MKMRPGGLVAALAIGAMGLTAPAEAQLQGFKGGGAGPGIARAPMSAGMAARPSMGAAGFSARPNGAGAFAARPSGAAGAFAGRNVGQAPLITGRSAFAPGAGAPAALGAGQGFAGRPGFAANGGFRRNGGSRIWPYAAAAGVGLAIGAGAYGYDNGYDSVGAYDSGFYDQGYAAPAYGAGYTVAPAYDPGYAVPAAALDDELEGGSCATPILVCRLYEPAQIGLGCSCTVNGGRAGGVVQP